MPESVSNSWNQSGFEGRIGPTYASSVPSWAAPISANGKPNVVFVVLDDMGFGSLGCYGSEIETPAIDRLAAEGIRLTNFHATAVCSPTRACLLTGRNHHSVGMAFLSHVDDGYPGYRGQISHRATTLAEVLVDAGYNTMAVGKWHLTPMDQTTAAGPYDQWPIGRGFERYYGFLEGLTDHYYPELFYDNHAVPPPARPEDGYHLTTDLIDKSIEFVRDQTAVAPERPFFLYLAFGATHTPHQAPADFVARYRGAYDEGWDVIRERRYNRQLEMGVIPPGTQLAPRNDGVVPWETLGQQERQLYAKFQEVYAAFLTHTDNELGRLFDYLRALGRLDNTIVVLLSDNGASQEGGPYGVLNTSIYENGHYPALEENLARIETIDGRTAHVNYPWGWAQAGNTPLKRYKQNTHAGGVRTSCIVRLPEAQHAGQLRSSFHHVIDVVPTVLDLIGLEPPAVYRGIQQMPMHGISMRPALAATDTTNHARTQYFETLGHRAIWKDGWKAVAYHPKGASYDDDVWELYNIDEDFSECHDLATAYPEKLAELVTAWWIEAGRYDVLPLDDRGFAERAAAHVRPGSPRDRNEFVFYNGIPHIGTGAAPVVAGHSFSIRAHIVRPDRASNGVLIAHGSVNSGYCLLLENGRLVYDFNYYGQHYETVSPVEVPLGASVVGMRFEKDDGATSGKVILTVDDADVCVETLPASFENFVAFQGLDIGGDRLSPVRRDGRGEFEFTGVIQKVVVSILDDPSTRTYEPFD